MTQQQRAGALAEVTEEVFELFPPPERGCCIDIGCGFGKTTHATG